MTIDEAIKHAEEVVDEKENFIKRTYETLAEDRFLFEEEENECKKCANEHRQLAEWLKDYKRLLKKEPNTWSLDDAREDFISDVYNTLDFLPTNEEANRIIDSFDRVTSNIEPQPCDDCISREEALKYSHIEYDDDGEGHRVVYAEDIEELPPVTPQPKTGHWNRVTDNAGYLVWECDKCGWQQQFNTNYCPDCGAKMEVNADDSN